MAAKGAKLTLPGLPVLAAPKIYPQTIPVEGAAGDWLCAWCHNHVANERDRFNHEGKNEFAFQNPDGLWFEILTFSETSGCRQEGVPALDYTWFAGCAWSYCMCAQCGRHLGWFYTGQQDFIGLIRARITRALFVRN